MNTHIVHKISLELPADSYENAVVYKNAAENWTKNLFTNIIFEILNSINNNNEYLLIDKLEFEVPDLPWKLTQQQWEKELRMQLSKINLVKLPFENVFEEFDFFLSNGTFKYSSTFKDLNAMDIYLLKNLDFFESQRKTIIERIFGSIIKINRLILNFSNLLVIEIFIKIYSVRKPESKVLYDIMKLTHSSRNMPETEILIFFKLLALENSQEMKKKCVMDFVEMKDLQIYQNKQNNITEIVENDTKNAELEKTENNFYKCHNAGIVLILPFLKKLFENLKVVENEKFIDENARYNALQIIVFLANGAKATTEEDYLLPKLLCGFGFNEFIFLEVPLNESQIQECDALLDSVIEHWKDLRNSSVEALRETFLQRQGRIKISENIFLEVENSGFDILLNNIPWGFRNYKLPWMEKTIETQWY